MRFLKNKVFLTIISFIFLLFIFQFYSISQSYKIDRNSYITLIEWNWILTSWSEKSILKTDNKEIIVSWDIISIIWDDSLAVIEWWDKSITRLAWNSKVLVKENFVSDDLWDINISFELLKWKTWSNVITIIWENSYFKQEIKWYTASVRGTVFEANYDSDYLYVEDHEVSVEDKTSWEVKKVYAWEWILFSNFLLEKIFEIKDKAWEEINKKLDKQYYEELRKQVIESISNVSFLEWIYLKISWFFSQENKVLGMVKSWEYAELNEYVNNLKEDEKQKVINSLKTLTQNLNFENWENESLYNLKINLKETLINNLNDENYKETLLKYSMYDLTNMLNYSDLSKEVLDKTTSLINKNMDIIESNSWNFENIKDKLSSLFKQNPEDLINNIKWNIENIDDSINTIINLLNK